MPTLSPPDPDRAWLATMAVLYVEDDEVTRTALAKFLRRRVGRLIEAADGLAGLARYRDERPALVITDIRMPGMDGLGMAGEIRRLDPDVPIVVTTAFEQVDYLERAIDAGVDKYVTKPVDMDKLEAVLISCARRLRAEAAIEREKRRELEAARSHEREVVGLLAGGMAHDFNNLHQVVLGNLGLASDLAMPGTELRAVIDAALESAEQAAKLGGKLVALSERSFAQLRPGAVEATVRSAVARALAGSATAVRLDLAAARVEILFDDELLGQAIANLTENAREAMAGRGSLDVVAEVRDLAEGDASDLPPGRYLQIALRDTGPGIAADILPRIFDPYFSTKPRGRVRGMGLGLALCRAILRQHRGVVAAESPPGGGAVFRVLLPAFGPATRE